MWKLIIGRSATYVRVSSEQSIFYIDSLFRNNNSTGLHSAKLHHHMVKKIVKFKYFKMHLCNYVC